MRKCRRPLRLQGSEPPRNSGTARRRGSSQSRTSERALDDYLTYGGGSGIQRGHQGPAVSIGARSPRRTAPGWIEWIREKCAAILWERTRQDQTRPQPARAGWTMSQAGTRRSLIICPMWALAIGVFPARSGEGRGHVFVVSHLVRRLSPGVVYVCGAQLCEIHRTKAASRHFKEQVANDGQRQVVRLRCLWEATVCGKKRRSARSTFQKPYGAPEREMGMGACPRAAWVAEKRKMGGGAAHATGSRWPLWRRRKGRRRWTPLPRSTPGLLFNVLCRVERINWRNPVRTKCLPVLSATHRSVWRPICSPRLGLDSSIDTGLYMCVFETQTTAMDGVFFFLVLFSTNHPFSTCSDEGQGVESLCVVTYRSYSGIHQ